MNIEKILRKENVKQHIKKSINNFSRYQKLEVQFQGILFSELLNSGDCPLLEDKSNNSCDISTRDEIIELKYQFDFDVLQMLSFYQNGKYEKLAKSIETDITNSTVFIMFILERNTAYLKNDCIFKKEGITFSNKHKSVIDIIKEYQEHLNNIYSNKKTIKFTNSFVIDEKWALHFISATNKSLQ